MNYYTADLHLGYERILQIANRPFASIEEMNETLVNNMVSRVSDNDTIYFLGDMSAYNIDATKDIRRIPGRKVLIKGNHDKEPLHHRSFRSCFDEIVSNTIVTDTVNGQTIKIFLSHYPMAEWDGYYKGIWHFYGHVHNACGGGATLISLLPRAINVGVDVCSFMPKTAEELIAKRMQTYQRPDEIDLDNILYPPFVTEERENVFSYTGFVQLKKND